MKKNPNNTITSFNDIQLAELIDLLKKVFDKATDYLEDTPNAYMKAFEGLIVSLEYYRLIDADLKKKDKSFEKLSLYENIKPTLIMSILRDSNKNDQKEKFEEGFQVLKDYIEQRKSDLTMNAKLIEDE